MRLKVLITGASGFVGYHLIEAALEAGMEVHAGVRGSSRRDHLEHLNIQYADTDLRNVESLTALLKAQQYDYIIHAAGATRARNQAEFNEVNAEYTRHLAQAVKDAGISLRKFVFISSLAAVGPVSYDANWPSPDGVNPKPVTAYGRSKLLAENYLAAFPELPWVVLRPTAVYGPRDKDLFVLFKTYRMGLEPYMGKIPQHLSFVYVKDVAQATIKALTSPVIQTSYDVSDGNSYDRYALAAVTKRLLKVKTLRIHMPLTFIRWIASIAEATSKGMPLLNKDRIRELTAQNWNCSIIRIKKDLGYQPDFSLEEGMRATLDWYTGNKWL